MQLAPIFHVCYSFLPLKDNQLPKSVYISTDVLSTLHTVIISLGIKRKESILGKFICSLLFNVNSEMKRTKHSTVFEHTHILHIYVLFCRKKLVENCFLICVAVAVAIAAATAAVVVVGIVHLCRSEYIFITSSAVAFLLLLILVHPYLYYYLAFMVLKVWVAVIASKLADMKLRTE